MFSLREITIFFSMSFVVWNGLEQGVVIWSGSKDLSSSSTASISLKNSWIRVSLSLIRFHVLVKKNWVKMSVYVLFLHSFFNCACNRLIFNCTARMANKRLPICISYYVYYSTERRLGGDTNLNQIVHRFSRCREKTIAAWRNRSARCNFSFHIKTRLM